MAWNPRPGARSEKARRAYNAGYSDGYYRARYGAGDEEPGSDYRDGFDDGRRDREKDPTADEDEEFLPDY